MTGASIDSGSGAGHGHIAAILKAMLDAKLASFWTALLARVEEVDNKRCRARVRPLAMMPRAPDKWEKMPELLEVPVDIARAGPFYVRRPYKEGDIVVLTVLSHSLERVLHDHEPHEPGTIHLNNLQDVVLLGGFRADTDGEYPAAWRDDLIVQNADTGSVIVFREDGTLEIYVDGKRALDIDVRGREDVRIRAAEGTLRLEAGSRVNLGDNPQYRVLLAEPTAAKYNEHTHTCPACGEPTSPPHQQIGDPEMSNLVYVQKHVPGRLHFPQLERPGEPIPKGLPPIANAGAWLAGIGATTNIPPGSLLEAFYEVVRAIGQALADAIGELVRELGELARELGAELLDAVVDAVKECLTENWLQLLGLALTNPVAAIGLFIEKLGVELVERLGGDEFIEHLRDWLVDKVAEIALRVAADALGADELESVVSQLRTLIDKYTTDDGELDWNAVGRAILQWAWDTYGKDGLRAAVSALIEALMATIAAQNRR